MPKKQTDKFNQEEFNAIVDKVRSIWKNNFDMRQRRLITNCCVYAANDPAGLPGHNLMLIIAKMASLLDQKVFDENL